MIVDSMDRSKWVVPRSAALQSKSFSSLIRPVLDCTGVIVHGHYVGIAFAEPHVIKGSDWSCELVVAVLEKLTQSGLDLRSFDLRLHADNCTKELKNNSLCRLLGLLVARGRVRRASLECLQTGHSHEDVDQFFSLLGTFLQTQTEVHSPTEFMVAVRQYLSNPSVRPQEKIREVLKLDRVRAWLLDDVIQFLVTQHF